MALDITVGLFLTDEPDAVADREATRLLDAVNTTLRRLGRPEHHEPRAAAPGVDVDLLGVRLGFYGSAKYERLADFAHSVAALGAVPRADAPYDAEADARHDALPDRRLAFDHVTAATGMGAVLLPQPFDTLLYAPEGSTGHGPLLSAARLRVECAALGYAFRFADSPAHDWVSNTTLPDTPFAHLATRIPDDTGTERAWQDEADLCHRLLLAAHDVLDSGALGLTG